MGDKSDFPSWHPSTSLSSAFLRKKFWLSRFPSPSALETRCIFRSGDTLLVVRDALFVVRGNVSLCMAVKIRQNQYRVHVESVQIDCHEQLLGAQTRKTLSGC